MLVNTVQLNAITLRRHMDHYRTVPSRITAYRALSLVDSPACHLQLNERTLTVSIDPTHGVYGVDSGLGLL